MLNECLKKINIDADCEKLEKFKAFYDILVEENEKMNLTSITEPTQVCLKHFLDSIAFFYFLKIQDNAHILDVGTGAGFPGIPIKILRPDLNITLMDSTLKKIVFLKKIKLELKLKKLNLIHARAEELSKNIEYRDKFDFSISRAVAKTIVLCELCLPYVKVGGYFLALKSKKLDEELNDETLEMITKLGAKISYVYVFAYDKFFDLKFAHVDSAIRKILVVKKIKNTPNEFPRKFSKICQKV